MPFLYSKWGSLDLATRIKFAQIFNIAKKGPTHVVNNHIETDGYDFADVEMAMNIDAIQSYLETSETDMAVLWDMLLKGKQEKAPEVQVEIPKKPSKKVVKKTVKKVSKK